MGVLRRVVLVLVVANLAGANLLGAGLGRAQAQLPPITLLPPPTTKPPPPTTEPSTTTSDTAPPEGESPPVEGDPLDPALDPGAGATPEQGGDGDASAEDPAAGRVVPAAARQVIDGVPRSGASDNSTLVAGAEALVARGASPDDAMRIAFGRFPVGGPARWSDDWLLPRWTGTVFRYHLGVDVMADYGTPLRAVADGVVRFTDSALGGLGLYLTDDEGTVFYYAHLGALAEGLAAGQRVATGDVVGFVGDSGNAAGTPHLHFAVHPGGGDPIPPKPVLDQWVVDAQAGVAALLAEAAAVRSRALVATAYLRRLADARPSVDDAPAGPARTDLLFASSANPAGGSLQLADASAAAVARSVDWEARALRQRAFAEAWERAAGRARTVLDPLVPAVLRDAAGSLSARTRG